MTYDAAPSSLTVDTDNGTLPAPPDVIHVPNVKATKGRKARTVKAPTAALFAPITSSAPIRGDYAVTVGQDDDAGLDVTVSTVGAVIRVSYHGPNDRTLIAGLKAKQGTSTAVDRAKEWGAEALAASTFRAVTLDAATVTDALAHVVPAMSTDETRYALNGLFIDSATGNWVATDGHRLHLFSAVESPWVKGVIIPRHAIVALEKAIKATKAENVIIGARHDMGVFVVMGESMTVEIRARLVDGQFPHYQNVIPSTEGVPAFTGNADALRKAIDSAPVIGDKYVSRVLRWTAGGVVTQRHDRAEFSLSLSGSVNFECKAHFNARYIDQALSELSGEIGVFLPDELSPMRIDNGPRMVIVMPMRA